VRRLLPFSPCGSRTGGKALTISTKRGGTGPFLSHPADACIWCVRRAHTHFSLRHFKRLGEAADRLARSALMGPAISIECTGGPRCETALPACEFSEHMLKRS
jgi:hypothetical protein